MFTCLWRNYFLTYYDMVLLFLLCERGVKNQYHLFMNPFFVRLDVKEEYTKKSCQLGPDGLFLVKGLFLRGEIKQCYDRKSDSNP